MDYLSHFKIPIKGLGVGHHELTFDVDNEFFKMFENSVLDNGQFDVKLFLQKKNDHSELDFFIEGTTIQVCDRCLSDVEIKIKGDYRVYLKYAEIESDDEDIIFMSPNDSHVNVAKIIFEIITVLLPLRKVCEEVDGKACNEDLLDSLYEENEEDVTNDGSLTSKTWDALKQIKFED